MKNKIEALLFSSGRKIRLEELSQLTGIKDLNAIRNALVQLKKEYEEKNTALKLIEEPDGYKMNVRDEHLPLINKIVTKTELSKTLTETLAVIAWKYPCLQAEIIKIRTNKAYDHLKELETMGFISREPSGRTKKIKLTEHFFEYFDLPTKESKLALKVRMSQDLREKINKMESHIVKKEIKLEEAQQEIKEQEEKLKNDKAKDLSEIENDVEEDEQNENTTNTNID